MERRIGRGGGEETGVREDDNGEEEGTLNCMEGERKEETHSTILAQKEGEPGNGASASS